MIMGLARDTDTGNGTNFMFGQFNGDSSAAYVQEKFTAVSNVLTGAYLSGEIGTLLGFSANGDTVPATKAAAFFAIIPHVHSAFQKTSILLAGRINYCVYCTSTWNNNENIEKITFSDTVGNILAGSVLSVYGLR